VISSLAIGLMGIRNVGVGLYAGLGVCAFVSLPLTLLMARLFGASAYESYWRYLESKSSGTRTRTLVIWLVVSVTLLLMAFGAALSRDS
jgi:hypothetical protein